MKALLYTLAAAMFAASIAIGCGGPKQLPQQSGKLDAMPAKIDTMSNAPSGAGAPPPAAPPATAPAP